MRGFFHRKNTMSTITASRMNGPYGNIAIEMVAAGAKALQPIVSHRSAFLATARTEMNCLEAPMYLVHLGSLEC